VNSIDIKELTKKLAQLSGKPLTHNVTEILGQQQATDTTVTHGSIQAVFGASVSASIHLFNDANDVDEDGVFGAAVPATPEPGSATTDWRPQLAYSGNRAWLKYALSASVTAKAGATIGMAGGSISGDRSLRLLSYRRHAPADNIGAAVVADLASMPGALSVTDVQALAEGEATALKVRGKLTATIELTWSDIFSASLRGLSGAAMKTDALLLQLPASAGVSFAVTVEDDLTLCFTRLAGTQPTFQVAVRKSGVHDARFQARAQIEIKFADPDAVRQVLGSMLTGLLEVPTAALEQISKATSLEQVPAQYRPYVAQLLERLGVDAANPFPALSKRLQELQSDMTRRIDALVMAKVNAGFEYEYLRMQGEASLMEATLSLPALKRLHDALVRFDLTTVLRDTGPGMSLRFFLHEKTIRRVTAWGFGLGVGTWLNLKGKQTRDRRFIRRRYVSPAGEWLTQSFMGSTKYVANINTWSAEYGASLKADMVDARPLLQTSTKELKYGLQLWWSESKVSPASELGKVVDACVLWGVVSAAATEGLRTRLQNALGTVSTCRVRLCMTFDNGELRSALNAISSSSNEQWCRHAARALPWFSKEPMRADCGTREMVYTPFFQAYQRAGELSGSAIKSLLQTKLRPFGSVSAREGIGETPWTAYQVLYRAGITHGGFRVPLSRLRTGAAQALQLIDRGGDLADVDGAFREMCTAFEQTYSIRMVAGLLASASAAADRAQQALQATLTVEYQQGGEDKTIVVAA
jgi:hypothetical protein